MHTTILNCVATLESLELVQRPELGLPVEKHPALDEPREPGVELIGSVATSGHSKHVVELFKRALSVGSRNNRQYNVRCGEAARRRNIMNLTWSLVQTRR